MKIAAYFQGILFPLNSSFSESYVLDGTVIAGLYYWEASFLLKNSFYFHFLNIYIFKKIRKQNKSIHNLSLLLPPPTQNNHLELFDGFPSCFCSVCLYHLS